MVFSIHYLMAGRHTILLTESSALNANVIFNKNSPPHRLHSDAGISLNMDCVLGYKNTHWCSEQNQKMRKLRGHLYQSM